MKEAAAYKLEHPCYFLTPGQINSPSLAVAVSMTMHAHHKIARAALRVAVGYACIMAGSAGGDTASNLVGDEDFCGLPLATAIAPDIMRTACEFTDSKGYMMGGHCTTSLCVGSRLAKTVCESDAAVACDSTQLCHGDGGGDGDKGRPPVHIMVILRTHSTRAHCVRTGLSRTHASMRHTPPPRSHHLSTAFIAITSHHQSPRHHRDRCPHHHHQLHQPTINPHLTRLTRAAPAQKWRAHVARCVGLLLRRRFGLVDGRGSGWRGHSCRTL